MDNEKSVDNPYRGGIAGHDRRPAAWVFFVCRLLLGLIFVYASYDKILHPQAFAQAVFNYQLLPDAAVNLTALVLPWLELLLGLCLVFGILLPRAIAAATGLMLVFLGALVFNQIRGLDIHCGCFSTETEEGPAGLGTVLRDLAFLAISLYLFITEFFVRRRGGTMPIRIRRREQSQK